MIKNSYPVVIVGASIAAISFIRTLRQNNDKREIALIHGEDRLPYKRTKINKHMVRGFDKEEFRIADEKWYVENNVKLIFDRVTDVNSTEHIVQTKLGLAIAYKKLLLATGAVVVLPQIAGIETKELHHVQSAADVDRLISACGDKKRFLVIGGGVEGVETADQLIRKQKHVILVNRMPHPLLKLFPLDIIRHLEEQMEKKGLLFYGGVSVSSVHSLSDGSYEISLRGKKHNVDVIVSCAGAVPNVELGHKAGIKVDRGIVVDEFMQTSDSDILAAGDVAQHARGVVTGLWHAAEHQGMLAALNVLDMHQAHTLPPYRLKTEIFGLFMFSAGYDNVIPGHDEAIEEHEGEIHRIMYYADNKLKAVVFVGDSQRAKTYQKALFEAWDKKRIALELPLPPKAVFSFLKTD